MRCRAKRVRLGRPSHAQQSQRKRFAALARVHRRSARTMVFNNETKLVNDPYKEERLAIAALPPAAPAVPDRAFQGSKLN